MVIYHLLFLCLTPLQNAITQRASGTDLTAAHRQGFRRCGAFPQVTHSTFQFANSAASEQPSQMNQLIRSDQTLTWTWFDRSVATEMRHCQRRLCSCRRLRGRGRGRPWTPMSTVFEPGGK